MARAYKCDLCGCLFEDRYTMKVQLANGKAFLAFIGIHDVCKDCLEKTAVKLKTMRDYGPEERED